MQRDVGKLGIPLLPSAKAGKRGAHLREQIITCRPDLEVCESYPYAVLRTLWAMHVSGLPPLLTDRIYADADLARVWWTWPPRYKRAARVGERRTAIGGVYDLLAKVQGFSLVVVRPDVQASTRKLAELSDGYDALLGLVAGIAAVDGSPWSWRAEVRDRDGAIVTIADRSLRDRAAELAARLGSVADRPPQR